MTSRVRVPGRRCRRARAAAAAVVGAPVLGLALLAGPAASAGPAGTVTFTGNCGVLGSGLMATSSPDAEQVSVPAGAELRFANQLGRTATLRLDGEAATEVPDGGTADVVFHAGPVQATMQIDCLLGKPAGAVTVEVAPLVQPEPEQPPSAGTTEPDPPASGGSGTDPAGGSGSGSSSAPGAGSGSGPSGSGAAPTGAAPDGGWWPDAPPAPGGETNGAPPGAESPSGPAAPGDGLSPRWGLATEPSAGGGSSADPDTVDPRAAGGAHAAEERVSRTSGSGLGDRASGLLALIATVCLVGVSAGAIRVIISQRADQAAGVPIGQQ